MVLDELFHDACKWVLNDYIRGKYELLDIGILLEETHVCQRFYVQGLLVDKFVFREVPAVDHRSQIALVDGLSRLHVNLQNEFTPVHLVRRQLLNQSDEEPLFNIRV